MVEPPDAFDAEQYWKRTIVRTSVLLLIWFAAGPLLGILLVEPMDGITVGGVPFGFWMAQQGAIYLFVIIIFVNAWLADRTDREFAVQEEPSGGGPGASAY